MLAALVALVWAVTHPLLENLVKVRDVVVFQTPKGQEIQQRLPAFDEALAQFDLPFQWNVSVDAGYDRSRLPPFSPFAVIQGQDTWSWQAQLSRAFLSGTLLQFQAQRSSNDFVLGNLPFNLARHLYVYSSGVTLSQSLWRNAWGQAWRRQRQALDHRQKAVLYGSQEEMEGYLGELFKLMAPFWVIDRQIQAMDAHEKRLEQLAQYVKERANWGFVLLGERETIEAELIAAKAQKQQLVSQKQSLQQSLSAVHPDLARFIPEYSQLVQLSQVYRPWRVCDRFDVTGNRAFKAQENQVLAQKASFEASQSQNRPDLQALVTYQWAGVNPQDSLAWDQYAQWLRSRTFVGIRFNWDFGHQARERIVQAQGYQLQEQQFRLAALRQELSRRFENARIQGFNWENQWIQLEQVRLRRAKARQQLTQAFQKGRVDFRTVFEAYSQEFSSEMKETQLVVEYLQWLGDWWNLMDTWLDDQFRLCQR